MTPVGVFFTAFLPLGVNEQALCQQPQFADKYYYKEDKQQAMNMVYEKLLEWPAGCVQELTPIDTQNFFVLCGMLAKYETRPKQELLDMVKNMIEGGAAA